MPKRTSKTGSELFIVDNSEVDWKVQRYLHDWCQLSKAIDVATGYFEIGGLLALRDEWQKVDAIRVLMGDEVSMRTKNAFASGLRQIQARLDRSIEAEKEKNDFLAGVPTVVEAIRSGKIRCRVYRKDKFHAKCYIIHARQEVVGSFALVGSSNLTLPGITENVELNVQISGSPVAVLQEWYEEHWNNAEDVTAEILQIIERHTCEYSPFEVFAKALYELLQRRELTASEWEQSQSKVYAKLAPYQQKGYHDLLAKALLHRGAFLCDGVGLGKTFVGLMLIERLVIRDGKNVALFVPKSAQAGLGKRVEAVPSQFVRQVQQFGHFQPHRPSARGRFLHRLGKRAGACRRDRDRRSAPLPQHGHQGRKRRRTQVALLETLRPGRRQTGVPAHRHAHQQPADRSSAHDRIVLAAASGLLQRRALGDTFPAGPFPQDGERHRAVDRSPRRRSRGNQSGRGGAGAQRGQSVQIARRAAEPGVRQEKSQHRRQFQGPFPHATRPSSSSVLGKADLW